MAEDHENLPEEVRQGLSLFKQDAYYQAHEEFETAWRKTQPPEREFYRALLQISGGFYRLTQNRPTAAIKFFKHALNWLAYFPDTHLGFNIRLLKKDLNLIISTIEQGQDELPQIKQLLHPLDPQENWII